MEDMLIHDGIEEPRGRGIGTPRPPASHGVQSPKVGVYCVSVWRLMNVMDDYNGKHCVVISSGHNRTHCSMVAVEYSLHRLFVQSA
jgi:hypothetical protein